MRAGIWFGPSFAGERVPTLEEAVALAAELGLGANVELKADRGREDATVGSELPTCLSRLGAISACEAARSCSSRRRSPRCRPGVTRGAGEPPSGIAVAAVFPELARGRQSRGLARGVHDPRRPPAPSTAAVMAEIREAGYPLLLIPSTIRAGEDCVRMGGHIGVFRYAR